MINYVAVKAATVVNNPDKVYFYYDAEPSGEWWMKAKKFCEPQKN